jgi:hypothetical protein
MPTFLSVKNNAYSTLQSGITAGATSLTVASGEGARFPTSNFNISIDSEILLCSSRSGDVFTVTRAQEGTSAAAHSAGAAVRLNITAKIITDLTDHISKLSNVRAYRATSNQTITTTTETKVQLNAEDWDIMGEFDPTTNYRFTALRAGYYLATGVVRFPTATVADKIYVAKIWKNGAQIAQTVFHSSSTATVQVGVSTIVYLTANDYIELAAYHTAGVDQYIGFGANETHMCIHQLS